jgi:hypothetical protein
MPARIRHSSSTQLRINNVTLTIDDYSEGYSSVSAAAMSPCQPETSRALEPSD